MREQADTGSELKPVLACAGALFELAKKANATAPIDCAPAPPTPQVRQVWHVEIRWHMGALPDCRADVAFPASGLPNKRWYVAAKAGHAAGAAWSSHSLS